MGGKTWREPTQTHREHANSTQKDPWPGIEPMTFLLTASTWREISPLKNKNKTKKLQSHLRWPVCRHRSIALSSNNCLWRDCAGAAESPLTLTESAAAEKKSLIENVMQWFCWAVKIRFSPLYAAPICLGTECKTRRVTKSACARKKLKKPAAS